MPSLNQHIKTHWLLILAIGLTALAMGRVLANDWVNWDDSAFILENTLIRSLSADHIIQMFSTPEVHGAYHPLTLISWAIDYQVGEYEPFVFHLSNLLIHLINVVLVYLLGRGLGLNVYWAAGLSLLFGMHPMQVEAVAWITSRKDVLFSMFYLTGLNFYISYVKKSSSQYYLLALAAFVFSLFSKNVALSFPLVLLLLDYLTKREGLKTILVEKIPFFLLTILFFFIAFYGQKEGGATQFDNWRWQESFTVPAYALWQYLFRLIIPVGLAAFHPYPYDISAALPIYMYVGFLGMLFLFLFIMWKGKKWYKVHFGLGFFLLLLLPTLQIIPFGPAAFAERFSYLANLGIFYLFIFGLKQLWEKAFIQNHIIKIGLFILIFIGLGILTFIQAGTWKNGERLWERVIAVYPKDYLGYANLADYYLALGEINQALKTYERLFEQEPNYALGYSNRAKIYMDQKQWDLSLQDLDQALKLSPNLKEALINRGMLYMNTGQDDLALTDFGRLVQDHPQYAAPHYNIGFILGRRGQYAEAIQYFDQAIELDSKQAIFYKDRGMATFLLADFETARQNYSTAIELNPLYGEAYVGRAHCYQQLGDLDKATEDAQMAIKLGAALSPAFLQSLNPGKLPPLN